MQSSFFSFGGMLQPEKSYPDAAKKAIEITALQFPLFSGAR
jgi:hypothetical protein